MRLDRKSTRLNSSHGSISYAVFCLKKKKIDEAARVGSSQAGKRQVEANGTLDHEPIPLTIVAAQDEPARDDHVVTRLAARLAGAVDCERASVNLTTLCRMSPAVFLVAVSSILIEGAPRRSVIQSHILNRSSSVCEIPTQVTPYFFF